MISSPILTPQCVPHAPVRLSRPSASLIVSHAPAHLLIFYGIHPDIMTNWNRQEIRKRSKFRFGLTFLFKFLSLTRLAWIRPSVLIRRKLLIAGSLQTGSDFGYLNIIIVLCSRIQDDTWWLNVQSGNNKPFWLLNKTNWDKGHTMIFLQTIVPCCMTFLFSRPGRVIL